VVSSKDRFKSLTSRTYRITYSSRTLRQVEHKQIGKDMGKEKYSDYERKKERERERVRAIC